MNNLKNKQYKFIFQVLINHTFILAIAIDPA